MGVVGGVLNLGSSGRVLSGARSLCALCTCSRLLWTKWHPVLAILVLAVWLCRTAGPRKTTRPWCSARESWQWKRPLTIGTLLMLGIPETPLCALPETRLFSISRRRLGISMSPDSACPPATRLEVCSGAGVSDDDLSPRLTCIVLFLPTCGAMSSPRFILWCLTAWNGPLRTLFRLLLGPVMPAANLFRTKGILRLIESRALRPLSAIIDGSERTPPWVLLDSVSISVVIRRTGLLRLGRATSLLTQLTPSLGLIRLGPAVRLTTPLSLPRPEKPALLTKFLLIELLGWPLRPADRYRMLTLCVHLLESLMIMFLTSIRVCGTLSTWTIDDSVWNMVGLVATISVPALVRGRTVVACVDLVVGPRVASADVARLRTLISLVVRVQCRHMIRATLLVLSGALRREIRACSCSCRVWLLASRTEPACVLVTTCAVSVLVVRVVVLLRLSMPSACVILVVSVRESGTILIAELLVRLTWWTTRLTWLTPLCWLVTISEPSALRDRIAFDRGISRRRTGSSLRVEMRCSVIMCALRSLGFRTCALWVLLLRCVIVLGMTPTMPLDEIVVQLPTCSIDLKIRQILLVLTGPCEMMPIWFLTCGLTTKSPLATLDMALTKIWTLVLPRPSARALLPRVGVMFVAVSRVVRRVYWSGCSWGTGSCTVGSWPGLAGCGLLGGWLWYVWGSKYQYSVGCL